MSDRRELKAKIRGVRSTEKLTGAMRTISTANYAKAVAAWGSFRTYADACDGMLREAGDAGFPRDPGAGDGGKGKVCLVVLTGNRALCGSYNEEVARLFARCLRAFLRFFADLLPIKIPPKLRHDPIKMNRVPGKGLAP